MGISDSPRQLMNQLQRATACSTTGSAAKTKRASTTSSACSHGGRTTAPRPNMGYISSQWHTKQPQAPPQLAATSWCRSHACRATDRAVSMPRSTEGKTPRKTPESSAPRPYIGYVSSQWHTRQPQALEQLAAISWCQSHAYRPTERAVSMPRSTEGKIP